MKTDVTIDDILAARERRAQRQQELAQRHSGARHGCVLVSYTLNIAGPHKRCAEADRCFYEGSREIERVFVRGGFSVRACFPTDAATGLECLWAIAPRTTDAMVPDATGALRLKAALAALEESHPLGRLFDIDVLSNDGGAPAKIPRSAVGLGERACLVCGAIGHGCARSRAHPLAEILDCTRRIIDGFFNKKDTAFIAACAVRALLYELAAAPKPGLVDRRNNGAHTDMDFFTFVDSALCLAPYFSDMAAAGIANRGIPPGELLPLLRGRGVAAEEEMLAATGGVNTHKGIIFSMGILCAACGYLGLPAAEPEVAGDTVVEPGAVRDAPRSAAVGDAAVIGRLLDTAGEIAAPALASDLRSITPQNASTNGEKAFARHAAPGIRGEAAAGFPTVRNFGIPALAAAITGGASIGDAGVQALLHMLAHTEDTNVIARAGIDALHEIQRDVQVFLDTQPPIDAVLRYAAALDDDFIARNISPGGCADLLAVTYMLHFVSTVKGVNPPMADLLGSFGKAKTPCS
ncbi:MAG: citrate lyase holo-[acyl-carrier protein] synthase [Treponema sp.]|nr:citrate lyase holo-[acyl-carrier protein] synthase [Treponema sp.]